MSKQLTFHPSESLESLEFDKILDLLKANCLSDLGIKALEANGFSYQIDELNFTLKQVAEMKSALENGLKFPSRHGLLYLYQKVIFLY